MIDRTIWERWRSLQDDGADGLLLQLMELFVSTAPPALQEIQAALAKSYAKGVSFHAHALKSSSASLGATQMAELCLKIETAGREGKIEPAAAWLKELVTEYALVEKELNLEIHKLKGSTST